MIPCLPAADPNPSARASAIAGDRALYTFDRSIGGLPLAKDVPKGQGYSAEYLVTAAGVSAMLLASRAEADRDPRLATERASWDAAMRAAAGGELAMIRAKLDDQKSRGLFAAPMVTAGAMSDFEALFHALPDPASRVPSEDPGFFAWQRLAGCNPAQLRRLDRPDPRFPVTEAQFRVPGDTLARAIGEGRAYLLDYSAFQGLPTAPSHGFDRYAYGALALFVRTASGELVAVAIQMGPTPDPERPIATPGDGAYWKHAVNVVQSADASSQGLSEHLGMCHVFANAVLLCTARTLAPNHPLRALLWPHFEMTLAANESMKTMVIGQDGFVDQLQGPTLAAGIELARAACADRSVKDNDLPRDLELRGMTDPALAYPYRDDGLPVHAAIGRWVQGYLELYYRSDAELRGDAELAAWYAALGSKDGGGLSGLHAIDTREGLASLITAIIYRITAYHAVINYGGYDFFAWPGTLPTARWSPAPTAGTKLDEQALLAALPPVGLADYTLELMLPQRQLKVNHLGKYPPFADPRVAPLVAQLGRELDAAESAISARDATRKWSFPYLRPSAIAQSIHV
jgi:arachidonate 15-lipoxygenase